MLRRILLSITVMGFGLLLGLAIAEAGVRIYLRLAPPAPQWSDRPAFYFAAPGNPTMQDYAYPEAKPANAFRIGVSGDSFTFAPYMQFTDTFVKKLEQMLNLNEHGIRAEVINQGVPGYSTSHEVATVQRALEKGADLIMVQITLNDPELKPLRPTGIYANVVDRFGELQPRPWQKRLFRYSKTAEIVMRRLHNNKTRRAYTDYFNGLFSKKRYWSNFKRSMTEIAKSCRAANRPVVAVIFPLFGLPLDAKYPFHPLHEKTHALLNELGVPYLDLFRTFAGIPPDRLLVIPGKDRHPNEIAHRMAAEALYVWLVEQRHVPQELRIGKAFAQRLGIANQPPYRSPAVEN